jgi:hypothetical protein
MSALVADRTSFLSYLSTFTSTSNMQISSLLILALTAIVIADPQISEGASTIPPIAFLTRLIPQKDPSFTSSVAPSTTTPTIRDVCDGKPCPSPTPYQTPLITSSTTRTTTRTSSSTRPWGDSPCIVTSSVAANGRIVKRLTCTTRSTTRTSTTVPGPPVPTSNKWQQCGGNLWTGPTVCRSLLPRIFSSHATFSNFEVGVDPGWPQSRCYM